MLYEYDIDYIDDHLTANLFFCVSMSYVKPASAKTWSSRSLPIKIVEILYIFVAVTMAKPDGFLDTVYYKNLTFCFRKDV